MESEDEELLDQDDAEGLEDEDDDEQAFGDDMAERDDDEFTKLLGQMRSRYVSLRYKSPGTYQPLRPCSLFWLISFHKLDEQLCICREASKNALCTQPPLHSCHRAAAQPQVAVGRSGAWHSTVSSAAPLPCWGCHCNPSHAALRYAASCHSR